MVLICDALNFHSHHAHDIWMNPGAVNYAEFVHMVKVHLKVPCCPECPICPLANPDNQPRTVYARHWAIDSELWHPAAQVLQVLLGHDITAYECSQGRGVGREGEGSCVC